MATTESVVDGSVLFSVYCTTLMVTSTSYKVHSIFRHLKKAYNDMSAESVVTHTLMREIIVKLFMICLNCFASEAYDGRFIFGGKFMKMSTHEQLHFYCTKCVNFVKQVF